MISWVSSQKSEIGGQVSSNGCEFEISSVGRLICRNVWQVLRSISEQVELNVKAFLGENNSTNNLLLLQDIP